MSPLEHLDVDRVVVELPHARYARLPWRWFELDLDHIDNQHLGTDPDTAATDAHFIAMTRHAEPQRIAAHMARPRTTAITHVQYEVTDPRQGRAAAEVIRRAGLVPLPAIHMSQMPASAGELALAVELLAGPGAPLIKLAYPAPDLLRIDWGICLLSAPPIPGIELALVPMGSRIGRSAALVAGSRLTWAPLTADGERWGADQLQTLLPPPVQARTKERDG